MQMQAGDLGKDTRREDALLAKRIAQAIRENPSGWLTLPSRGEDRVVLKALQCYEAVMAGRESLAVTTMRRRAIENTLEAVRSSMLLER
jgi:hypothetical protein